ncbi:ATPase domain containing protein [Aphelenchoides fujianensis]|nr:ATPase domain containing protein [Aphelenchoides fujianensis]
MQEIMAAPKLNFFEKIANLTGVIYRHHAGHFPRRWGTFKKVCERELAPPMTRDWPAVKKDFAQLLKSIQAKEYKNLTVREFAVYTAVGIEVICWFFVGEMIGRWSPTGYVVPATYVSKEQRKKDKEAQPEDKHNL